MLRLHFRMLNAAILLSLLMRAHDAQGVSFNSPNHQRDVSSGFGEGSRGNLTGSRSTEHYSVAPTRLERASGDLNSLASNDSNTASQPLDPITVQKLPGMAEIETKSDQLAMLGRLFNGIYLQWGVLDDLFSGHDAVAEFLNTKLVVLTKVVNFNKTNVDAFLTNLKAAKQMDKNSLGIELRVNAAEEAMRIWKSDMHGRELFFKNLSGSFEKLDALKQLDLTVFKPDVMPILDTIEQMFNADTEKEKPRVLINLVMQCREELVPLEKMLTLLKSPKSRNISWNDLVAFSQNLEEHIGIFGKAVKTYYKAPLLNLSAIETSVKKVLQGNVDRIKSLAFNSGEFDTMLSVLSRSRLWLYMHTSGFVNGYSDLKRIQDDYSNPWLQETLKTKVPIAEKLVLLTNLGEKARHVDEIWSKTSIPKIRQTMEKIIRWQATAANIQSGSDTVDSAIGSLVSCFKNQIDQNLEQSLGSIYKNSGLLTLSVQTLSTEFESVTDEHIQNVKNLIAIMEAADLNQITGTIDKMKKFDGTPKIIEILQQLKPHLEAVRNTADFIEEIASKKDFLTNFLKDNDTMVADHFFRCFSETAPKRKTFSEAVDAITFLRNSNVTDNVIADIERVSELVAESVPAVKSLLAFPEELKIEVDNEWTDLRKYNKSYTFSPEIGDGIIGVFAVRRAMEKSATFEKLMNQLPIVDAEIESLKDFLVRLEVTNAWGDSNVTMTTLEDLLFQLSERPKHAERTARSIHGFEGFLKVFSSAPFSNFRFNVRQKLKALDALVAANPASKSKVDEARKLLEEIEPMDLEFARFNSEFPKLSDHLRVVLREFPDPMTTTTAPTTSKASVAQKAETPTSSTARKHYTPATTPHYLLVEYRRHWWIAQIMLPIWLAIPVVACAVFYWMYGAPWGKKRPKKQTKKVKKQGKK